MADRKADPRSGPGSTRAAQPSSEAAADRNHDAMVDVLARFDGFRARCKRQEWEARRNTAAWSRWSAETDRRDALVAQVARIPATNFHDALIKTVVVATGLLDDDALNDLAARRRLQRLIRELRNLIGQ